MTSLRIYGACPHDCPDTCGVVSEVVDGRAVRFQGDPDHPVTRGWLCAKVRPYLDHVYHPDRLLYPFRRVGPKGSGQWQRLSWEEALAEIGARWKEIITAYGAEAILPYSYSGTLGLVQMSVASARFWNRLGASQLQRSICGAAAELAVEATLGARWSPPYADVVHSRLVILWAHNPVSTAPHFLPFLREAQRRGCRLVVIDPRRTLTARGADLHLAPLPGTDGVLALGLGHMLVAEGLHDEAWLEQHTIGWPMLRERLTQFPPERVAGITGLPRQAILDLARLYGSTRPGLIKIADGVNRNRNGGQNVRAICTLPALTGQYGQRGGGLAYSTSGYLKWNAQAVHQQLPVTRTVNMNRLGAALLGEAADPPIMALYVFGANPAASAPNSGRVIQGLRREDLFTVVHELFLTDTADWADIVLPATSQLEHTDLHKAYGHAHVTYNRPAIAPLGESKSNWEVMSLLALAMGFDEPWLQQSPDEVIEEVLRATAVHNPALRGLTLEQLRAGGAILLAVEAAPPFADGRFPTPSGKVELVSPTLANLGVDPLPGCFHESDDDQPTASAAPWDLAEALHLVSGASHHFVSTSLANQAGLLHGEGPPFLEIHPADATGRGITSGETVIVENGRGRCRLRAVVTDAVRPGVVVSPKGRWSKRDGPNVNWTTSDVLGDMAGQSTFHSNRVWVRRVESQDH
ncbi:MAG: molybdopterin-dependent oxidoreductase [Planctomycetes bacterium]|nr:molybdopterin-dependent oxidoreductase [Planctomycetota bacterium]